MGIIVPWTFWTKIAKTPDQLFRGDKLFRDAGVWLYRVARTGNIIQWVFDRAKPKTVCELVKTTKLKTTSEGDVV